jgi:ATPase subunit of ABC transporter with duplicated ATPase domains
VKNFTASVSRGEKIGILGRNGAGKTTLLRSLVANGPGANDEPFTVDGGKVEWGHEVAIGYFAQDHRASIQPGLTILDWLQQFDPTAGNEELRGLLGQMLFARDEAMKPTQALSGGEAARLLFCKLMLQKPNVLALDEPTNHLDLESINALNFAIQKYEGTVFLVTHDHDLLEETSTRIWRMSANGIEDFRGAYEEYQAAVA